MNDHAYWYDMKHFAVLTQGTDRLAYRLKPKIGLRQVTNAKTPFAPFKVS